VKPRQGDSDGVLCGGGAWPTDTHLLADVRAVDGEIVEWLDEGAMTRRCGKCQIC
jgi:hypothetical protein